MTQNLSRRRKNNVKHLLLVLYAAVVHPGVTGTETSILVIGAKRIMQVKNVKHLLLVLITAVVQPGIAGTATSTLVIGTKRIMQMKKRETLTFSVISGSSPTRSFRN